MKFRFTLALWGDWHLSQFERNGLPSLRAAGNLNAIDYHISVHTRPADFYRLSVMLQDINADIKVPLADDTQSDQGTANAVVHNCKMQDYAGATANGEAWVLMSPDMVWGEGTFVHHRQAFEAGKTAIFRPLLRVDADKAGTITDFGKRSLARIALEHEHNVSQKFYRADSPLFSSHAEMIIWPAPGGLLNKTITAEIQTCMAGHALYGSECLATEAAKESMLVVGDSDEAIALALAPPNKDFSHVVGTSPLTPDIVRTFANWYWSPATEKIARHSYRLHAEDIDLAEWAAVERNANDFIAEVFG